MLIFSQHSESGEAETSLGQQPEKSKHWMYVLLFFPPKGETMSCVFSPNCTRLCQFVGGVIGVKHNTIPFSAVMHFPRVLGLYNLFLKFL